MSESATHLPKSRVFISPDAVAGNVVSIHDPQALHHLVGVVRLRVGDWLECFDGRGGSYLGVVRECTRERLVMAIEERRTADKPLQRVTLAQALIRPTHFEWVIQKATELGVTDLIPLITSRTRVQRTPDGGGQKLQRWRRIASEAARQCGRTVVPSVDQPRSFEEVLTLIGDQPTFLFTLVKGGGDFGQQLREFKTASRMTLFIGPEGDFSPGEVEAAKQQHVRVVQLGRTPFRSETAALVALAIARYVQGAL